jgi:hypothetical protein
MPTKLNNPKTKVQKIDQGLSAAQINSILNKHQKLEKSKSKPSLKHFYLVFAGLLICLISIYSINQLKNKNNSKLYLPEYLPQASLDTKDLGWKKVVDKQNPETLSFISQTSEVIITQLNSSLDSQDLLYKLDKQNIHPEQIILKGIKYYLYENSIYWVDKETEFKLIFKGSIDQEEAIHIASSI